jgi:hypothetical protein
MAPTDPMPPQTMVNPFVSSHPPNPPTTIEPKICNDSIDNDANCDLSQIQQQQLSPTMQQKPSKITNPEICDDDLDNDLDGKVDNKDEECAYITGSASSLPLLGQEQSVAGEQTEEEGEGEEGDGGDNSEEPNNEEGEDEEEEG